MKMLNILKCLKLKSKKINNKKSIYNFDKGYKPKYVITTKKNDCS